MDSSGQFSPDVRDVHPVTTVHCRAKPLQESAVRVDTCSCGLYRRPQVRPLPSNSIYLSVSLVFFLFFFTRAVISHCEFVSKRQPLTSMHILISGVTALIIYLFKASFFLHISFFGTQRATDRNSSGTISVKIWRLGSRASVQASVILPLSAPTRILWQMCNLRHSMLVHVRHRLSLV